METSTGMRSGIRKVDLSFGDSDLDVVSSNSARNFVAEAVHALRRRWIAAALVGSAVGVSVAVFVWNSVSRQYSATAVLRVSMGEQSILEPGQNRDASTAFDVYKRTQRQLLRSPVVLRAALQRESVSRLPSVTHQIDPLTWLQNLVNVTFPDEAEIMHVSISCEDQQAAETLVDTIVDVYLQDVVYAEREEKNNRLKTLEKAEADMEATLRRKRSDLRQMADKLGAGDSEALTLAQKNTLQEYSLLWTELNKVEFELKRAQRAQQIKSRTGAADSQALDAVSEAEVDLLASNDPIIATAKTQLDRQQSRIDEAKRTMYGSAAVEFIASYQGTLDRTRKRIEERREVLKKDLAFRKQNTAQSNEQFSAMSVELLEAQHKELTARVAALRKEADTFGRSSIDAELLRAEIKSLETTYSRLQTERQEASVEVATLKSRVAKLSSATTPAGDDKKRRLTLSGGSGVAGFFAGGVLVVLWDLRRRRLNTLREIADELRLPILGSLPHVPRLHGRNATSVGFEEAIDGIVARLVFSASGESPQVVLVTSAVASEGKTTVATNLASGFAGLGRRTVLVDFDLRRPMLHNLFGIDLAPGACEVLAGQTDPLNAIVPTSVDNLFLLPAGVWGNRELSGRNDERVKTFVNELRDAFTNVVIDAGPVLPIVDTRVIARHADGVVLSLLRDVSEIPRVNSACEQLRSFDTAILGAVMIGVPGEAYYSSYLPKLPNSA